MSHFLKRNRPLLIITVSLASVIGVFGCGKEATKASAPGTSQTKGGAAPNGSGASIIDPVVAAKLAKFKESMKTPATPEQISNLNARIQAVQTKTNLTLTYSDEYKKSAEAIRNFTSFVNNLENWFDRGLLAKGKAYTKIDMDVMGFGETDSTRQAIVDVTASESEILDFLNRQPNPQDLSSWADRVSKRVLAVQQKTHIKVSGHGSDLDSLKNYDSFLSKFENWYDGKQLASGKAYTEITMASYFSDDLAAELQVNI